MRTESPREKIFSVKLELDCMRRKIKRISEDMERRGAAPASTDARRRGLPVFCVEGNDGANDLHNRIGAALNEAVEQMRQAIVNLDIAFEAYKEGEGRNGQA